jgi:ATP synthase subunit 6
MNGSGFSMGLQTDASSDIRGLSVGDRENKRDSKDSTSFPKLPSSGTGNILMSSLMTSKLAPGASKSAVASALTQAAAASRAMSSAAAAPTPTTSTGPRTETGVVKGFHDNPLNPAAITWWPTLFLTILIGNLMGRLPYFCVDGAMTGALGVSLGLSFTVWTAWTVMGLANSGQKFFKLFIPGGSPPALAPVFAALELVSYFFRAISLGVRLWANMFSGHTLLHILTSMSLALVFCLDGFLRLPITLGLCTLLSALVGLEWLILFLQSGVFVMLSSFYAGEVAELGGDDE